MTALAWIVINALIWACFVGICLATVRRETSVRKNQPCDGLGISPEFYADALARIRKGGA